MMSLVGQWGKYWFSRVWCFETSLYHIALGAGKAHGNLQVWPSGRHREVGDPSRRFRIEFGTGGFVPGVRHLV